MNSNDKNLTGPQIRFYRKQRGWTQQRLANTLRTMEANITRQMIANMETQRCSVTDRQLVAIAEALRIPVARFFTGDLPVARRTKPAVENPPPAHRLIKLACWLSVPVRKLFGHCQGGQ